MPTDPVISGLDEVSGFEDTAVMVLELDASVAPTRPQTCPDWPPSPQPDRPPPQPRHAAIFPAVKRAQTAS